MTELQAEAVIEILSDVRRMVELGVWSVFIATGFVVGNTLHRWARGR